MNNFWENILRYPRFFISSVIGLVLIILTPFRNLFKLKRIRIILIFGLLFLFMVFIYIMKNILVI